MTEIFKQRIHDAVNACQAILNFTEAAAFDDYSENLMLRSAVEKAV